MRRGLPKKLRVYIDAVIAKGVKVENIRDIWYSIKGDIEHLNNKKDDSKWDKYVNEIIGEHLYEDLFLQGNTTIYDDLGLISKGLTIDNGSIHTPIVLFSEKTTRAMDEALEGLSCARYDSTGQVPSFEAVKIAEYLINTTDDDAYIVALTDYDPAGDSIYKSLTTKVQECLEAFGSLIELHQIRIKYGSDYESIINSFPNFTLSTDPKNTLNQVWIKSGRTKGVELNVLPDKQQMFTDSILANVEPEVVERVSLSREINYVYNKRLNDSDEYKKLLQALEDFKNKVWRDVVDMDATFSYEWDGVDHHSVRKMTRLS